MKILDSAAANGDGLNYRHSELALQHLRIELKPVALREIDHVQGDERRMAELDQLQREPEVIVEV